MTRSMSEEGDLQPSSSLNGRTQSEKPAPRPRGLDPPRAPGEAADRNATSARLEPVGAGELCARDLFENLPIGLSICDSEGKILAANPMSARLLGLSQSETQESSILDAAGSVVRPDGTLMPVEEFPAWQALREQRFVDGAELGVRRPDGGIIWLSVSAAPLSGPAGGAVVTYVDIGDRVRADEALRQAKNRYLAIFENAVEGIYQTTPEGRIEEANPAFARMLGYDSPEQLCREVVNLGTDVYVDPERREELKRLLSTQRVVHNFEAELRCRRGGTVWLALDAAAVVDPLDQTVRYQGSAVDITDRKRAERALVHSERKFRTLFESLVEGVALYEVVYDDAGQPVDYRVIDLNPAYTMHTGIPFEQARGALGSAIYRAAPPPFLAEFNCVAGGGEPLTFETYYASLRRYFRVSVISPQPGMFATVFEDVTLRRQSEERLRLGSRRTTALLKLYQMSDAPLPEITNFAMEEAVHLTRSEIGYLALLNDDETILTMHAWSQKAMRECAIDEKPRFFVVAETGLLGEAVRRRRPVITNDYAAPDPVKRGYPEGHAQIRRFLNLPIFSGPHIVMVAGLANKEDAYDDTDVQELTLLLQGMWRLMERKRVGEALQASEERYRITAAKTGQIFYDYDVKTGGIVWNGAMTECTGLSEEEYADLDVQAWAGRIHPEDREVAIRLLDAAERAVSEYDVEYRFRRKDGSYVQVEDHGVFLPGPDGTSARMLGIMKDVSERRRTEQELSARARELSTIHRVSQITLNATSLDEAFQSVSEEICKATGFPIVTVELYDAYTNCMQVKGCCGWDRPPGPADAAGEGSVSLGLMAVQTGRTRLEVRPDRDWKAAEEPLRRLGVCTLLCSPMKIGDRPIGAVCLAHQEVRPRDEQLVHLCGSLANSLALLTERRRAEEQIEYLAHHDPLTGLPNRTLFRDRLEVAIIQARRNQKRLSVLYLDLDRFKVVNDSLGHSAGDRFLQLVSERLTGCVRHGDTVARLGGDEFVVLLSEVSHPEDSARVAGKVRDILRKPFELDGREVFVTVSIGASSFPEDGEDVESLLRNADIAMYRAKAARGDCCRLFTPMMNRRASVQLSLEADLHNAVLRDEFIVYYQPMVNLKRGGVEGVEALVRWRHPQRGLVHPGQFIPLAEETGLIVPIGLQVLRKACRESASWRDAEGNLLRLAVNFSLRQLQQPDLRREVEQCLQETGREPETLDLEITESAAIESVRSHRTVLDELRAAGLRMSLDDFGSGYSSLNHLRRLPIDTLKMDRSFVHSSVRDPSDAAIARAIIAMAHSLNQRVVAEGVDRAAQREFLRGEGCDAMQGYVFSRPLPAGELEALLQRARARSAG